MKKPFIQLASSLISALIYAFLFSGKELGINVLLFSFLSVGIAWWLFPQKRDDKSVQYLYITTIVSALLYTWHHSMLAYITHLFSFILLVGFLQKEPIRFVVFGGMLGITSILEVPFMSIRNSKKLFPASSELAIIVRWVPYVVLPSIFLFVFSSIYYNANSRFAQAVNFMWPSFDWHWIWKSGFLLDFLIGIFIISALIGASGLAITFFNLEQQLPLKLSRKRTKWVRWSFKNLSLKREYWTAVGSLITLNLLLFLVNISDLRYVWINYGNASPQELSQYVHEGTYLLIFAILLAMGVIIWYFRGNLNFYKDKGLLKIMAYVWLAQNGMLALSVALRNWQYVQQYGLTYKRLGVFWFLTLVAFGLVTMYKKVDKKYTLSKVVNLNIWALFASLMLFSTINWNNTITLYNIRSNAHLDTHFLFERMSSKNLVVLQKNKEKILAKSNLNFLELEKKLERKQRDFQLVTAGHSWRGWNWVDTCNRK